MSVFRIFHGSLTGHRKSFTFTVSPVSRLISSVIDGAGVSWSAAVGGESYTCDAADVSVGGLGSIDLETWGSSA